MLQSGVLTSRGSYKQEFLQSGVYISVFFMTGLCQDIDIDGCSLHSGIQINVSHMIGLCPDVDSDRCSLHSGIQMNVSYMAGLCPYDQGSVLIVNFYI